MNFEDVSVPEVYRESADFRFFLKWFKYALTKTKFDIENFLDLYDPLRCPENFLWMLAENVGYKYDTRLSPAYCRLVLIYFMDMIRLKGSITGITMAAQVNLAQFNIIAYGLEHEILNHRLEDTSIPTNMVNVTPHTDKGYIDVVYFATEKPIDACIEYVRPLGMYLFQHSGVKMNAKNRISVDARLANINDTGINIGSTRVAHYSRNEYASLQHASEETLQSANIDHVRDLAYESNSDIQDPTMYAGYRTLFSLQLCNNEHMFKSMIDPIFSLGYNPQNSEVVFPNDYLIQDDEPAYNLRYDKELDRYITTDTYVLDENRISETNPLTESKPMVGPVMSTLGDALAVSSNIPNTRFTEIADQSPKEEDGTRKKRNEERIINQSDDGFEESTGHWEDGVFKKD